jgi:hypothetical protein
MGCGISISKKCEKLIDFFCFFPVKFHFPWFEFCFLFFTRSGRLGFASVPDFQNPPFGVCTRVYHFLTMWYNTGSQQLQSAFFLEWGYHSRRSTIQVLTVPMLLHFCTRNRDPKPSSNSDLPVAWITGPTTDPSLLVRVTTVITFSLATSFKLWTLNKLAYIEEDLLGE